MTRRTFLLSLPLAAAAQRRFTEELDTLRRKYRIPGLSVAVLRNQEIAWKDAFGFQDIPRRVVATPDTPYPIASLTKTFASTLLMQLLEQGKLDLDEPIKKFAPAGDPLFRELNDGSIKIRHLLTHTSEGRPGFDFRYNGRRFAALTHVLEQSSGRSFPDLLAGRILDPLRMTRSMPGHDHEAKRYAEVLAELARPYRIDDRGRMLTADYPPKHINASVGLISTVVDLARFDAAIDEHTLIRRETQEVAWTPAVSPDGRTLPYALGWFVQSVDGQRLVWHYGDCKGSFSALYLKVPEKQTTLLLLANTDGLARPFPALLEGDVMASDFARLFLRNT